MKTTRKMIPAIAMLLISAVMLTTASYAWFTIGTTATATGMQVKAEAQSTMLIAKGDGDAQTALDGATNEVSFSETAAAVLLPATQDTTVTSVSDVVSGLKTIKDTQASVDHFTGTLKDGVDAEGAFEDVAVAANSEYYFDYALLIASGGGAPMEGGKLYATINTSEIPEAVIHNALTIMFIVSTYEKGAMGENHLVVKNMETLKTTGKVDLGVDTVPDVFDADGNLKGYVSVTMRVYYDGALEQPNTDGKTYVRNQQVDLSGNAVPFSVLFTYEKTTGQ